MSRMTRIEVDSLLDEIVGMKHYHTRLEDIENPDGVRVVKQRSNADRRNSDYSYGDVVGRNADPSRDSYYCLMRRRCNK